MCDRQCPAGRLGGARGCLALAASLAVTLYASIRRVAALHTPPKLADPHCLAGLLAGASGCPLPARPLTQTCRGPCF